MKAIGFMALHYGKPYMASAIRSVIDAVDEFHIIYSDVGSHGHQSDMACPDTRDELLEIALSAGSKLRWHEGRYQHEGFQRDAIFNLAPDADIVLVVDSDEVYPEGMAAEAISLAANSGCRVHRLPFVHFWRSFYRCVLHDPAYPTRVINTRNASGETTLQVRPVAHLGYAIPVELCRYKLTTHGHHNEFRHDVDWLNDVYIANRQHDCHVVGSDYWNPETVNPLDYMPSWMSEHPYYGKAVIE
jgi:hypothetical protein